MPSLISDWWMVGWLGRWSSLHNAASLSVALSTRWNVLDGAIKEYNIVFMCTVAWIADNVYSSFFRVKISMECSKLKTKHYVPHTGGVYHTTDQ